MRRGLKIGGFGCLGIIAILVALAAYGSTLPKSTQQVAAPTAIQQAPPAVVDKPADQPTLAPTVAPTSAPPPTNEPTAAPTPRPTAPPTATAVPPTPTPSVPNFGEGTKLVGTDIQPGTYRSKNSGTGCYWARLTGMGGTTAEIIANDNAFGPALVTIEATDTGFISRRCAQWTQDLSPLRADANAPFGDGTMIVGVDVAPGTWRAESASGCYWARTRGFSGKTDQIIANDNARGPAVVQIAPTDKGFLSRRCGNWTKAG